MTKEDEILEILHEHTKILNEHTRILDEHTKKLDEHTNRLDKYDDKFKSITKILISIEEDVSVKIPLLFEDHEFHQDHLERHDDEIKKLQSKVENHSVRLISLELDSKKHSKQLKHLSSTN